METCAGLGAEPGAIDGLASTVGNVNKMTECAEPSLSQSSQQSSNNSNPAEAAGGKVKARAKTKDKCQKKKKKAKKHPTRDEGKAKEVEIEEGASDAEKRELPESCPSNAGEEEETESKCTEEKRPQQHLIVDGSASESAGKGAKKHKKTGAAEQARKRPKEEHEHESESSLHEPGEGASTDESPSPSSPPPPHAIHGEATATTTTTKRKGSRKKTKKKQQQREVDMGKGKEAVRDTTSLSVESVAVFAVGEKAAKMETGMANEKMEEEETMMMTIGLLELPEEVLLGVLSFLAPIDLVRLSQACRLLHLLSREPSILRMLRVRPRHSREARAKLRPLYVHPAYYALEQPRFTFRQLESLETPSVVLERLVEDGFFFLRLDEAEVQIVRDMKAAAARFLASSESLDAMSRRSMLYLKTSAAGYAEAPELNSFQTTVTHHRWFPWPDATDHDKEVAVRYWRLMGRITVVLLTNLAKHLGIPMSVMELLLFSRKKVMHRYGDDSFLAGDSVHVQWSCELCTLLNPATRRTCAACQGPRPLVPRPAPTTVDPAEGDDAALPRPPNGEAAATAPEAHAGNAFARERVVRVTDGELDRLMAPTLKFYRFRELEKRRKDEWRRRDGSLRVSAVTPRGNDVDGNAHGERIVHLLEEPTPLPLQSGQPAGDAQQQQQRRKPKNGFATQLNMMPCNAMFKLVSAHSTDPDLCQIELRTERPDGDSSRANRLPLSKIANEGDIAVFPSWSLRTFCAPFGIRFAYRQPSYRVRSRVVHVLPDGLPVSSSSSSSSSSPPPPPSTADIDANGDKRSPPPPPPGEGRENRSMSDPTMSSSAAAAAAPHASVPQAVSGKGKEKLRAGAKSSSVIVLSKEAKRALVKRHKKAALMLEFDSYVPPPDLVCCMKRVIAMMEKEGNKSVGRWYKKKRGRIIEACPWNRYYPSSSDSDSDSDEFSDWDSTTSDSFGTSDDDGDAQGEEEDGQNAGGNNGARSDDEDSDSDSDTEEYYGGFPGGAGGGGGYSDSDLSSSASEEGRLRHLGASEDEAVLADVSYWNGPMPLTKHERRERDRRDRRRRRIRKAKKVALTTAFVAAVPVTIVTAPIWLPIGGALMLGLRHRYRRR